MWEGNLISIQLAAWPPRTASFPPSRQNKREYHQDWREKDKKNMDSCLGKISANYHWQISSSALEKLLYRQTVSKTCRSPTPPKKTFTSEINTPVTSRRGKTQTEIQRKWHRQSSPPYRNMGLHSPNSECIPAKPNLKGMENL